MLLGVRACVAVPLELRLEVCDTVEVTLSVMLRVCEKDGVLLGVPDALRVGACDGDTVELIVWLLVDAALGVGL